MKEKIKNHEEQDVLKNQENEENTDTISETEHHVEEKEETVVEEAIQNEEATEEKPNKKLISKELQHKIENISDAAKPIFREVVEIGKLWFSKNPFEAFSYQLTKNAIVAVIATTIVGGMLATMFFPRSLFSFAQEWPIFSSFLTELFVKMAFVFLGLMAAFYGLLVVTIKAIVSYFKAEKNDWMSIWRFVAIINIPILVIATVGTLAGIVLGPLSSLSSVVLTLFVVIALYVGLMKYFEIQDSFLFWVFIIAVSVFMAVYLFIAGATILSVISSSFPLWSLN